MNSFLGFVAEKIWDFLKDWLNDLKIEMTPKLWEYVGNLFSEWMPKIIQAVIVAISQAAGQFFVNSTKKVTDVIPGKVDDVIVGTIVDRTRDALSQFGVRI